MARYIQKERDVPPAFSLKDNVHSWTLSYPVDQRPKRWRSKINRKSMLLVMLRYLGELALIDSDPRMIWKVLKTGHAVHVSHLPALGRPASSP